MTFTTDFALPNKNSAVVQKTMNAINAFLSNTVFSYSDLTDSDMTVELANVLLKLESSSTLLHRSVLSQLKIIKESRFNQAYNKLYNKK